MIVWLKGSLGSRILVLRRQDLSMAPVSAHLTESGPDRFNKGRWRLLQVTFSAVPKVVGVLEAKIDARVLVPR